MRLNPYIIKDHIGSIPLCGRLLSDRLQCSILRPAFYTNCINFNSELLYIVPSQRLLHPDHIPEHICFVLTEPPEKTLLGSKADLLYPDRHTEPALLLDALLELFQYFSRWEMNLYKSFSDQNPLQALGDCSVDILRNPAFISDSAFRLLCCYERQKPRQFRYFEPGDSGAYIAEDSIQELLSNDDFLSTWATDEPSLFGSDLEHGICLYQNISVFSKKIARVVLSQIDEPIRDGDYAILNFFSGFVAQALEHQDTILFSRHPAYLDQALLDLAHGVCENYSQLLSQIHALNWKQNDPYFCCIIHAPRDSKIGSISNACQRLEDGIHGSCAVKDEEHIFFIVNLAQAEQNRDTATSVIAGLLREFLFKAGISMEFHDFYRLPYYYRQAHIALTLGQQYDDTLWSYRFENYMLHYITEQSTRELDAEALCPAGLLKLLRYDRKKGRSYAATLRIFLENNMNTASTIRKIHMQRATFLYQLNKIQELTGLNLQNPETRLLLLIAYQLLDRENKLTS